MTKYFLGILNIYILACLAAKNMSIYYKARALVKCAHVMNCSNDILDHAISD